MINGIEKILNKWWGKRVPMDNEVKLSIIIPVYNTKKYLKKCIDSVINQEYRNTEIILVDDGSTDGSGELCDEYQHIDKRIQVIHQKNSGSTLARLHGLEYSHGEYVGFIDSDDWIAPDMYTILMSISEQKKCDIVSMGYTFVRGGKEEKEEDGTLFGLYEKGKNLDILISNMMYDPKGKRRGIHPSLCTKVIKREYLINSYLNIDERITMGDDAAVFYPCCLDINSIFILKDYKYYYRVHSESMCTTMNINTIDEIYFFYQYMNNKFKKLEKSYHLLTQLKKYTWTFLNPWLKQVFDFQVETVFLFPYNLLEKNTEIILYGAGRVGQAYYYQLSAIQYCNIVAWVDKNIKYGGHILPPDKIMHLSYSKIVVAVKEEKVANEIIEELSTSGIRKEKIIWAKPQEILPIFFVD